MENNVNRTPRMGPWVLIRANWYKTGDITSRYVHANVNSLRPMFDEIAQGLMRNYDGSYLGDDGEPEHVYDEDDDF